MKKLCISSLTTVLSILVLSSVSTFVEAVSPEPDTAETPISAQLSINQTPAETPLPSGNDGGADQSTGINGLFGIAYAPKQLSVNGMLNDTGSQELNLSNIGSVAQKYNVGVQDKTRLSTQTWTLKAKLSWSGANANYMTGTTIKATNGNVRENIGGTLTSLTGSPVQTNSQNLEISEIETTVMFSTNGETMNGVYNYQFESPRLVIPNVANVPSGTYTGMINWNLESTPAAYQS